MIVSLLNFRINDVVSGAHHNICIGTTRDVSKTKSSDEGKGKETIVFSWGDNEFGQLAQEGDEFSENPKIIEWFNDKILKKIDCGQNHSLFLLGRTITY